MNLLLDTHALLWWLDASPRLSEKASAEIANGENLVFVSAVVVWEIRIKEALGKLCIPPNFREVLEKENFENLPITSSHAHAVARLPAHHRDPFDRMLVAQALEESLNVVTHDRQIGLYDINILW